MNNPTSPANAFRFPTPEREEEGESTMSRRSMIALASVGAAFVFVGLTSVVLTEGFFAEFLLDRNSRALPYPFTIQNVMWIVFFVGAGELLERWLQTDGERLQIHRELLPEDEETLLRKQDLGGLFRRVKQTRAEGDYFLQRLLSRCILQFQVSGAIDKANNMFNSSLELFQHEIELKYNALRYVVWLIPTLGFHRHGRRHRPGAQRRRQRGRLSGPDAAQDPDAESRRRVLHDLAGAVAVRGADVRAARGAGPRRSNAEPHRAALPGQPHQPVVPDGLTPQHRKGAAHAGTTRCRRQSRDRRVEKGGERRSAPGRAHGVPPGPGSRPGPPADADPYEARTVTSRSRTAAGPTEPAGDARTRIYRPGARPPQPAPETPAAATRP